MDRERKLLYAVAVLAPILEALMMFALYGESDLPARTAAALEEARSCQQHLLRAWAACGPGHFRPEGI
jgi:hypothetical protein